MCFIEIFFLSDGYREGDGYRIPAGYRVRHIFPKKSFCGQFCLSSFKVCWYSNIEYENGNSEKHMEEMADQSQQESRKRIVNFYDRNKEKGKSFTCAFFKKLGFAKSTVYTCSPVIRG